MEANSKKAVVIGCGIAGPVVALALKRAGWQAEIREANVGPRDDAGMFLNVVANGVNVLKTLGIHDRVVAYGFPFGGIVFHDEKGREIGTIDYGDQEHDFGAEGIIIKRGLLQRALRDAAIDAGVPVSFGKKLVAVEERAGGVIARFADGTSAIGDILVGCDGINSRGRRAIFPDAPAPDFTGLYGYGGFCRGTELPVTGRMMNMHFGRAAFSGYVTAPDGEVYWFGNAAGAEDAEPTDEREVARRVVALHAGDPEPVSAIIRATTSAIGWYPIQDMPSLPRWHSGRVVLVGDAAHAMAPHVGQGASLAMEDAVVLAKCLRDIAEPGAGFARYEDLRRGRVERIGRAARRGGDRKTPGPLMRVVRNLLMPLFLKLGEKASREAYAYRIDWDEKVSEDLSRPFQRAA